MMNENIKDWKRIISKMRTDKEINKHYYNGVKDMFYSLTREIKEEEKRIMKNLDYVLVYGTNKDFTEKEIKDFKKMFKNIIWGEER